MQIELKKISHSPSLSEETEAFTAEIYINGKNVGYAKNSGHGGSTDYHAHYNGNDKDMKENRRLLEEAEAYCKTLPAKPFDLGGGHKGVHKMDLESFIDDELYKFLAQKDIKKTIKKLEKDCLKSICIISKKALEDFKAGKTTGIAYSTFGWKRPIAEIPVEVIKKQLPAIQAKLKGDEFIYNTNLPK